MSKLKHHTPKYHLDAPRVTFLREGCVNGFAPVREGRKGGEDKKKKKEEETKKSREKLEDQTNKERQGAKKLELRK